MTIRYRSAWRWLLPALLIVSVRGEVHADDVQRITSVIRESETVFENYAFTAVIEYFKNGRKNNEATCALVISLDNSIAMIKKPEVDRGKIILLNGPNYFLYFPKPDRYIRVSARSSLFGNVSYGDLIKPPILKYYRIEGIRKDVKNNIDIVTFVLKQDVREIPFYKKVVYFNNGRSSIDRIDSFSRSNILLGSTINMKFEKINGVNFPVQNKIVDIRNPGCYSLQRSLSIRVVTIPKRFFQPYSLRDAGAYMTHKLGL